mmetsp:Transcript_21696/g.30168  ORF Transcript_21696/g.30168 Transcript_21696/m.30168 type:complete len:237 (+) Transcript_21696:1795-2505(+)
MLDESDASTVVSVDAHPVELLDDGLGVLILGDDAFAVEQVHVASAQCGADLEFLLQPLCQCNAHVALRELDLKVNGCIRVVFLVVRDERRLLFLLGLYHVLQKVLVVLSPLPDRQLSDLDRGFVQLLNDSRDLVREALVPRLLRHRLNGSVEALVPGMHGLQLLVFEHALKVGNDVPRVEVGDVGAPSCADSVSTIDQHHGEDGYVDLGLDLLAVIVLVLEELVVALWEDDAGDGA